MIGDRLVRVARHAFVTLLMVVASATVLFAQTVVDPRYVEFTPSADHSALASDGTPLVQRYSLSIFPVGSSVASATTDLGKPAPSGGIIRVDLLQFLQSVPTGVVFEARVTAVGPGGSAASSVSNGFSLQAPCAPTINPTGQSVGSAASTGSVGVTAGSGCTWSAVSNAGWITLSGATSGTGNGTVPYSVAANSSTSARSGTLTVAGRTYTVNQSALSCSYSLSPTGQSVAATGGTGSTTVTAPAGCAWTGVSNHPSWLTVTSGGSGNGAGTVAFSASSNPNTSPRTGTITIGGQTFSVTQAATSCTFALLPASQSVAASGGTGSTTVTALAGCAWTGVSNSPSWLTITSGASGNGAGTVAFSVAANPNGTQRNGSLTIAGQTFSVSQAATPCTYAISQPNQSVAAGGGTGSTTVTAPTGCAWTGVSNNTSWLTVTSGASGNGGGTVGFSAAANASTAQRTGTLTIGGQTLTVTQAGVVCTYSIAPMSQTVGAGMTNGSTTVTAPSGCSWTAVSNNTSWLTVTSGATGNGGGSVAFSAAGNSSTTQRVGSLTVAGQTLTVTQAGVGCTFSISTNSLSPPAAGGAGSTNVTAPAGCPWSAASNAAWITVTSGASGSGNGSTAFTVAANPNATARSGTLTIAALTFTVSQAAAACTYSLSPTSQQVVAGGGGGSTTITTLTGCAWTATSNAGGWLTVSGPASGSSTATVNFAVAANTSTQPRSGALTIGGQTFSVTQNAASCTFTVSPTSQTVAAAGGNGTATVATTTGCAWTAATSAAWITITGGATGSGAGSATFTVAPNTFSTQRTGILTIAGRPFTVTQAASTCTYTLTPASRTHTGAGGTGTITVGTSSGCAWQATTTQSWISVSGNGTASGSVSYTVQPNTGSSSRTGSINIGTQVFSVVQGTGGGTAPVSPAGLRILAVGGSD